jgi:hypothetical protein
MVQRTHQSRVVGLGFGPHAIQVMVHGLDLERSEVLIFLQRYPNDRQLGALHTLFLLSYT